jgi:hypothetical protein
MTSASKKIQKNERRKTMKKNAGTYEVEVKDETANSTEKESYWAEIRHDFREDSPVGCGDVVAAVSVDAWRTSDDNAEGEVIARVFLTKKGDVVIDYINAIARTDVLAQESIKETVKELREQLFDGEVRDK